MSKNSAKPSILKRIWTSSIFQAIMLLLAVYLLWQLLYLGFKGTQKEILMPSANAILNSLWQETIDGTLLIKTAYSFKLILVGMGISIALTVALVVLSMIIKPVKSLCHTLISVLDPLPGIALLPVAMLWAGLGPGSIIFVMVHSILWPMLLNILTGFDSVPLIYQEVGSSIGLSGIRMIFGVYIPASVPSIVTGFKTGWSRAWRALISSEMVYGVVSGLGGLGWDIYTKKVYINMPGMFATLIVIMIIGFVVEKALFNTLERHTVKKWGMSA